MSTDLPFRDFGPQDFCDAYCDYQFRCASFSKPLCLSQCTQTAQPALQQKYSATYTTTLAACYATLACQGSAEKCSNAAILAADPNCLANATVTACTAAYKGCSISGSDKCLSYCGLVPSGQAALAACLAQTCANLDACVVPLISTTK